MSHFLVLICVPNDLPNEELDEYISQKMAPFSENLEVEPYETPCYCIGLEATTEVRDQADNMFGSLNDARDAHWKELNEWKKNNGFEGVDAFDPHIRKQGDMMWKSKTAARFMYEDSALSVHPKKNKPASNCTTCHGTGVHKTTYNPKSKWDWYRIGGRWDGVVRKIEVTSADKGFNFSDIHELPQNNRISIQEFDPSVGFFAILTPSGDWLENGNMGWWGIVTEGKDNWAEESLRIIEGLKNQPIDVVGVDCHI